MAAFEELAVQPEIIRGIEEMGWTLPRDIQAECIPLILGGGDVCAAAETGSGKTAAFALPIVQIVHEQLRDTVQSAGQKTQKGKLKEAVVLNADDRQGMFAIGDCGLRGQTRQEFQWEGCRSTVGFVSGRYYHEMTVTDEGLCRVGYSLGGATYDLGTDKRSFGYGGTAKAAHAQEFANYGETYGKDDVVGCLLDIEAGEISFSKNGNDLGKAFTLPASTKGFALYPAVTAKNAEVLFNFGASPFRFAPPEGSIAINDALIENTTVSGKGLAFKGRAPVCIIVEPTRELAEQVQEQIECFKKYIPDPNPTTVLCCGGQTADKRVLRKGVDLVIGTPGRLISLLEEGALDMSDIRFFVLDEADRLLVDSFRRDVLTLFNRCPKTSKKLQVLLFSATLHDPEVKSFSNIICRFPAWIDLKGEGSVPRTVDHFVYPIDPKRATWWHNTPYGPIQTDGIHRQDKTSLKLQSKEDVSQGIKLMKGQALIRMIETYDMPQAIIFCRTKVDCNDVETFLKSFGKGGINPHSCKCFHSGVPARNRGPHLEEFKRGEFRYLVCTDVAARGIDVVGLPCVFNYTLPDNAADYIHRIGRTGRADLMGLAVSLIATEQEKVWYHGCPSKGKKCNNTNLVENGGCGLWYDEPKLREEIEEKLGAPLMEIGEDFSLPGKDLSDYGNKTIEQEVIVLDNHTEELIPTVKELSTIETAVQDAFLNWKLRRWA